jgi:hypothetical protein
MRIALVLLEKAHVELAHLEFVAERATIPSRRERPTPFAPTAQTVGSHVRQIMRKLDVSNRTALLVRAFTDGFRMSSSAGNPLAPPVRNSAFSRRTGTAL